MSESKTRRINAKMLLAAVTGVPDAEYLDIKLMSSADRVWCTHLPETYVVRDLDTPLQELVEPVQVIYMEPIAFDAIHIGVVGRCPKCQQVYMHVYKQPAGTLPIGSKATMLESYGFEFTGMSYKHRSLWGPQFSLDQVERFSFAQLEQYARMAADRAKEMYDYESRR